MHSIAPRPTAASAARRLAQGFALSAAVVPRRSDVAAGEVPFRMRSAEPLQPRSLNPMQCHHDALTAVPDRAASGSVVLLHSSAASARQWDTLAQPLVACFDVHAIDLHGHGARAPWRGKAPLTLADEAALVEPLLERGNRVHLVGHSYGGAVALEVARRHPRTVQSVAVFEPVLFRLLQGDAASRVEAQTMNAMAATLRGLVAAGRDAAAAERFVDHWSGPGAWARLTAAHQAGVAQRMRSVASHFGALVGATDPTPALARSGLPLLCLTGARTVASTRRIAQLLRSELPRAEHATLPAMGHMGPLTHAAAVNTRITDFLLRQVEPARRDAALSFLQPETI